MVRPYDLFARYGGEEFILLVANVEVAVQNLADEALYRAKHKGRSNVMFYTDTKSELLVTQTSE